MKCTTLDLFDQERKPRERETMSNYRHPGEGGDYVQEVARNAKLFPVRVEHKAVAGKALKGAAIDLPPTLYAYHDPDATGRVVWAFSHNGVQRTGITTIDLIAILSLAMQRAVTALEAKVAEGEAAA
jgi:hypothetical protein